MYVLRRVFYDKFSFTLREKRRLTGKSPKKMLGPQSADVTNKDASNVLFWCLRIAVLDNPLQDREVVLLYLVLTSLTAKLHEASDAACVGSAW